MCSSLSLLLLLWKNSVQIWLFVSEINPDLLRFTFKHSVFTLSLREREKVRLWVWPVQFFNILTGQGGSLKGVKSLLS